MPDQPLAYHITFGTYGTRLHGDERGSVDRRHNVPGEPVLGRKDSWRQIEVARLRYQPILLTLEQRLHVQSVMPAVCSRGNWELHAATSQPDHVHVLLASSGDGSAIRRWLKAWVGQELSARWPLPAGQSWWAEGGSVKWVWEQAYLNRVFEYVEEQKAYP